MNQKVEFETKESYEQFIAESKNKLEEYKDLASQEEYACLVEVEKAIDISYNNQHPNVATYKELFEYYYAKEDYEYSYNYSNIIDKCGLKGIATSLKNEMSVANVGNVVLIETRLADLFHSYEVDFVFNDLILGSVTTPRVDGTLKKVELTTRDLIIKNEIKYNSSILELVGEKHE